MSAPPPPSAPVSLVISDVRVIDPGSNTDAIADVVIEDGQIVALGRGVAKMRGAGAHFQKLDGRGKVLAPGLIELRAHLGEPGFEYREDIASGLKAAAAGGFVAVCSQPDTDPVNDQRPITEALCARAKSVGLARLYPLAASTVGLKGEQLTELGDLLAAGAHAVSSGRAFVRNSAIMRRLMQYSRSFDALVMQQPQDPSLVGNGVMHEGAVAARLGLSGWPRAAEEIALGRDLALCRTTGARYHASSITTKEGVQLLSQALDRGITVSSDVTPAHLLLSDRDVLGYDSRFRLDPPLREPSDQAVLLEGLRTGVITAISSDHKPHSALETHCEFDQAEAGATGLELCLSLVWSLVATEQLSALRAVECLTTAPAKTLGLSAPTLAEKAEATLTLFDPAESWKVEPQSLFSKGKNTPFLGQVRQGRVVLTLNAGRVTFDLSAERARRDPPIRSENSRVTQ